MAFKGLQENYYDHGATRTLNAGQCDGRIESKKCPGKGAICRQSKGRVAVYHCWKISAIKNCKIGILKLLEKITCTGVKICNRSAEKGAMARYLLHLPAGISFCAK